jgi:16S rRNA (guanine527-N7)-methyltransferase
VKSSDPTNVMSLRLERLRERYDFSEHQLGQLEAILQRLATDARAPTGVRDPAQAADVHLADSLVALELDVLPAEGRIADLGAGAGFPGVALAVALPGSEVRMVEAQARKCAFMEKLCATAGITNTQVVCARVEEWSEGVGTNDVVLARALAGIPIVVEYAAPLLRVGGTLVDWRGRRDPEAERLGLGAAHQLGLELVGIHRVEPYEGARDHHLHIYVKDRKTPEGFPRRAGMARKRPLVS